MHAGTAGWLSPLRRNKAFCQSRATSGPVDGFAHQPRCDPHRTPLWLVYNVHGVVLGEAVNGSRRQNICVSVTHARTHAEAVWWRWHSVFRQWRVSADSCCRYIHWYQPRLERVCRHMCQSWSVYYDRPTHRSRITVCDMISKADDVSLLLTLSELLSLVSGCVLLHDLILSRGAAMISRFIIENQFFFKAKMWNICCFQLLKCENFLHISVFYKVLGFRTVIWTKYAFWRRHFGLWRAYFAFF